MPTHLLHRAVTKHQPEVTTVTFSLDLTDVTAPGMFGEACAVATVKENPMETAKYLAILCRTLGATHDQGMRNGAEWLNQPKNPRIVLDEVTPFWNFTCPDGVLVSTFTAEEEQESLSDHFRGCGWDAKQINRIRNYDWFSAHVQVYWLVKPVGGYFPEDLAAEPPVFSGEDYLGACCYKRTQEFITTYRDDYLLDLLGDALEIPATATAPHARALEQAQCWVREQQRERYAQQMVQAEARKRLPPVIPVPN